MLTNQTDGVVQTVDALLTLNDEAFITVAYSTILGRHPDEAGRSHYLGRLRAGLSKLQIIAELRMSAEGRARGEQLRGLDKAVKKYRLARTPLIGRFMAGQSAAVPRESDRALRAIENQLIIATNQNREAMERMEAAMRALAARPVLVVPSPAATSVPAAGAAAAPATTAPELYVDAEHNSTYDLTHERQVHAAYIAEIQASGLFDAEFYLNTYPVDAAFYHRPELHYILFGEKKGWQPNPVFWPDNYLLYNTDVAAAGALPFRHFLSIGRHEGRISRPLPKLEGGLATTSMPTLRQRGFAKPNRIAVCLHVFYVDLWPELVENLGRLTVPFDLFVGLIDRGQPLDAAQRQVLADFPDARVFVFPNHGRDIFPFVSMAAAGLFDPYEAVCKIHTKKSPHRDDGTDWRHTLVNGILPKNGANALLERFLSNPSWGLLVADGQIYEGEEWWGSNKETVPRLLHRVEIKPALDKLRFPAGSIYWIKQPLLNLIRGMLLGADDFDIEARQLDGTPAHAFERVLGYLGEAAGVDIVDTTTVLNARVERSVASRRKPFVSCFYLPQFHRFPENDAWWGAGYTEWVGAARARAQFDGHNQPVTPAGSGFYDLRDPEVIGEQFQLAKAHGVDAFCIYYYMFDNGKRLMETPIDNLLKRPEVEACFYLCWANESWTRNWDGLSGEVLMPQSYLPNCVSELAKDTARHFADKRYFRLHGTEPRFVIYRPDDIPNLPKFIKALRAAWAAEGFPKVNLGAVLFHTGGSSSEESAALFDFIVEMPPHGLVAPHGWIYNKDAPTHDASFPVRRSFKGLIYDYNHVIGQSINRVLPSYLKGKLIRGVMPSWDNTARRGSTAHICYGGNPAGFGRWIKGLVEVDTQGSELMINSWNEWAEKAMIEPGDQYGHGYLDALKRAFAGMEQGTLAAPVQTVPAVSGLQRKSHSTKGRRK